MICKKEWSLVLIRNFLGEKAIKKIHDMRFEIALKREYTKLDNEKVNLYTLREIKAKKSLINEMRKAMRIYKKSYEENKFTDPEVARENHLLWQEQSQKINEIKSVLQKLQNKGVKNSTFILKCPKSGCDGVIDPDSETCVGCHIDVCMACGKKISFSKIHTCKDDDIQTVEMLKENTKNCPQCTSCIFRAEGCTQMFCTICYTAFDWLTMKIVTNNIHNPHYFGLLKKGVLNNNNYRTEDFIKYIYINRLDHLYPKNYDSRLFSIVPLAHDDVDRDQTAIIDNHELQLRKFREKLLLGSITAKIFENRVRKLELNHELNMVRIKHRLAVKEVAKKCIKNVIKILRDDMMFTVSGDKNSWYLFYEFIGNLNTVEKINIFKEYLEIALNELKKSSKQIIALIYEYKEKVDIYSHINNCYDEFESFINQYNADNDIISDDE